VLLTCPGCEVGGLVSGRAQAWCDMQWLAAAEALRTCSMAPSKGQLTRSTRRSVLLLISRVTSEAAKVWWCSCSGAMVMSWW
jgi:hypothetical protein